MIDRVNKGTAEAAMNMRIVEEELRRLVMRPVRVSDVIDAVIAETGIEASQLLGTSRRAHVVKAKQVCTVCLRECSGLSYPEIAIRMGKANVTRKGGHTAAYDRCNRERTDETNELIDRVKERLGWKARMQVIR
jgi:hypothetical protein